MQPWFLAVGGWRLVAVGGWRLAVGGGWWRLVVGDWWLVAVGGWQLVVGGGWKRLAVGGWQFMLVGGWWSLGVVLNKKRNWVPLAPLRGGDGHEVTLPPLGGGGGGGRCTAQSKHENCSSSSIPYFSSAPLAPSFCYAFWAKWRFLGGGRFQGERGGKVRPVRS